ATRPAQALSAPDLSDRAVAASPATPVNTVAAKKPSGLWETGSFSFRDIIDAINPLQHIPIISTIYRKLTGDSMGYASRIVGDTLFGGVFGSFISGLVSAVANVFMDAATGKDIGEHMVAAVMPETAPATAPLVYTAKPENRQTIVHASPQGVSETQDVLPTQAGKMILKVASHAGAAIDQYKWQILAGDVKQDSHYWG
ncbi:MAG: hypothetical protein Q9M27_01365, partial [Mariprofundaceae bacterium]|nr:hypothetical protein [Mariprofundaceae bacterium]